MQAGFDRRLIWNGLDDAGLRMPTGVYFCRLDTDGGSFARKMVMMN
jgi:hypothetical protein